MRILLLLALFLNQSIFTEEKDTFEGSITLTVPGNRLLDNLQVGVDFDEFDDLVLVEKQSSEDAEDMLQIGSKALITLKENYKQQVRYKNSKMTSSEGVFYLFDMADELKSVFIKPKYYTRNNEFNSDGQTDKIFALEVFEITNLGETEGRILKTIENISLAINKDNEIIVNQPINAGTRVAVRLYAMETADVHVLHLPTKKKGNYLCQYANGIDEGFQKSYNANIGFRYLKRDTAAKNRRLRAFQMVADEINNYVKNSAYYGSGRVVEIPLKIRMKLAPEGIETKNRIIIGPPAPEKPFETKPEEPKRKKNLLGF